MCIDGDGAKVWNERTMRARKRWRCDECGTSIPAGVEYVRIGALDDVWCTMRVHAECLDLWHRVHDELCGGKGLIMIGGLQEEFDYAGDELAAPYQAEYEAIQARYREATT